MLNTKKILTKMLTRGNTLVNDSIDVEYQDITVTVNANTIVEATADIVVKPGYKAKCIVGWSVTGTNSSYLVINRLAVVESENKIYYMARNLNTSRLTNVGIRAFVLYVRNV